MKQIKNYDGYFACDDGKIFSQKTGIYLKPYKDAYGYYTVGLHKGGKFGKTKRVHRLVAETLIENPFNCPEVNHIDGCKTNNAISNLEWCTSSENHKHAFSIGLSNTSEKLKKWLSEYAKTRVGGFGTRAKIIIDSSNGMIYSTITNAAIANNIKPKTLSAMLTGQSNNRTNLKCY